MSVGTITVPSVYCPILSRRHRFDSAVMDAFALPWLFDIGLLTEDDPLCHTSTADWSARVSPEGIDDRVLLLGAAAYWSFCWDDDHSRGSLIGLSNLAVSAGRAGRIIDNPESTGFPSDDRHARFLREFMMAVRRTATPDQAKLVADGLNRYVLSSLWRNGLIGIDRPASFGEYLDMRCADACDTWSVGTINWVCDNHLTAADLESPLIRVANTTAAAAMGLSNDLVSFNWERGDTRRANAVDAVMLADGCARDVAVDKVVRCHDQAVSMFLIAFDRIHAEGTSTQAKFADHLSHWIRGNLDWGNHTSRYFGHLIDSDFTVTEVEPGPLGIRDHSPAANEASPPVAEGTEWWWTSLGLVPTTR